MQFLVPYFQERPTLCSLQSFVTGSSSSGPSIHEDVEPQLGSDQEELEKEEEPPSRKRRKTTQTNIENSEERRLDEMHHAVLQCAKSVTNSVMNPPPRSEPESNRSKPACAEHGNDDRALESFFKYIYLETAKLSKNSQKRVKRKIFEILCEETDGESTTV